jgi:Ser/Thr protein kinase RdoA (MazF antagonist)
LRDEFSVEPLRVSLLAAHSFNTLFRADLDGRAPVAVRVGEVRIHADRVEEVEAHWLHALRTETDLRVPVLLADRHGDHVAAGLHPLVPGRRFVSVMTWVPGRIVRASLGHSTAWRMGVIQATLHDQAASYSPPEVPAGITADQVVYFGDSSLLPGYESTYGSMFVEAIDRVQAHLDALWTTPPHRPHLLHGDLGPQNVMRWRTRLSPIDFQDLQFGFDLQDVAITVADLRRVYADESLIDALVQGYRSVRPWPLNDEPLEQALAAGRSLNVINLGLNLRRPGLPEFIERHSALVAEWMTGLASKPTLI